MIDLIERIKQSVKKHSYHIVHGINNHDEGMTVQGFYQVIDEELAKEPHEFKMRDATAEEQKYIQAKIDKIKEPQKCEWNRQGAEDFIITGCGHRPYKVIIDNCGFKIDFCPYCGKQVE